MQTDRTDINALKKEIETLQIQNKKLQITTDYFKMKYEEGLEQLKQEQNELLEQIQSIDKYKYQYEYPRPAVTTDCVVFGYGKKKDENKKDEKGLHLLLIRRGNEPFKGEWALPGGFIQIHADRENAETEETLEECARRELKEETHLDIPEPEMLKLFQVYSKPGRDPRQRVISAAYIAILKMSQVENVEGGDDAAYAEWISCSDLPDTMAFDHQKIIEDAKAFLRQMICFEPVVFSLVDETFTLPEIHKAYEDIIGQEIDRGNFQKKLLNLPQGKCFVEEIEGRPEGSPSRIAKKYRFNLEAYKRFKEEGYRLEFNPKPSAARIKSSSVK